MEAVHSYAVQERVLVGPRPSKASLVDSLVKHWNSGTRAPSTLDLQPQQPQNSQPSSEVEPSFSAEQLDQFSHEFATWFYGMLATMTGFGVVHFWEDARMTVVREEVHPIGFARSSVTTNVDGAGEVVRYYVEEVARSGGNVRFDPFQVRGEQNSFGLTVVHAKGTVSTSLSSIFSLNCIHGLWTRR
jgi:hypothetical protein